MASSISLLLGVQTLTCDINIVGSAIVVFGTVPESMSECEPPTVAYFLDNLPPSVTTLPHATADTHDQPLYASPNLSANEEHLLFINVTKTQPGVPYALAGFSLSFLRLAPNFNSTQSSQSIPTATPSTTPTSASSITMPDHKTISIVAGVLGSLVFLFSVGTAIFVILRWRTRRETSEGFCPEVSRSGE
jgi:hypothetical protein